MTKKRKVPDVEEILKRPWCYYCERDFDDIKILISHQRAKHFKCERCNRRLNTIGGLHVHMSQVHKETLTVVENALEHRNEVKPEIFAMEGIPEDILNAHKQRITEAFFRLEEDRRTATGNPAPGGQGGNGGGQVKKRKVESIEETKKRLAKHKARRQAAKLGLAYESESESESEGEGGTPADGAPVTDESPKPDSPQAAQSHSQYAAPPHSGFNPYQPPPQQGYPPFANSPMNGQPFQGPGFAPSPYHAVAPTYPLNLPNFHPGDTPPHLQHLYPYGPPPPGYTGLMHDGRPHQPFPPVSSSSGPPMSAPGMMPGLPAPAPGLPQRPSFGTPNLSKEEMAKMHSGLGVPHGVTAQPPYYGIPDRRYTGPKESRMQTERSGSGIGDAVDDLISSVTGQVKRETHEGPMIKSEPRGGSDEPRIKSEPRDGNGEPKINPEPQEEMRKALPVSAPVDTIYGRTVMPWPKGIKSVPPFIPYVSPVRANVKPAAAPTGAPRVAPLAITNDVAAPPAIANDVAATPSTTQKPTKKSKKFKKSTAEFQSLVYGDNDTSPEEKMARTSRYSFDRNASEKTEFVQDDVSGAVTGEMGEDVVRDPDDSHY
ncbi:hypothetical protein B0A55_08461 [Friedmanniomyces simplex]|uniref:C2H2-type domain-containing protein n=1 Tax=Friedmanniomyces simplex TaxID=329884 RepID=A0A4U0WV52_9PEZI|nr:hypothetical protein B0A55_08461 [Friedmanniomyces simplex]